MSAFPGVEEPPFESAVAPQQLSSGQNRAEHAAAPREGLATLSLATWIPHSTPAADAVPAQEQRRCLPDSVAAAAASPVSIPARAAVGPDSQSGSFTDAPLSLSPGTLRIASLSLVTPPSELVTNDMLGAAAEGAAAPRAATAAGASPAEPAYTGTTTSDMLKAVARSAASARAVNYNSVRGNTAAGAGSTADGAIEAAEGTASPAFDGLSTRGGMRPEPGRLRAAGEQRPLRPNEGGKGRASAAGTDQGGRDAENGLKQTGHPQSPLPGAAAPLVDAGLLSSFMSAGPRGSFEQVSHTAAWRSIWHCVCISRLHRL